MKFSFAGTQARFVAERNETKIAEGEGKPDKLMFMSRLFHRLCDQTLLLQLRDENERDPYERGIRN